MWHVRNIFIHLLILSIFLSFWQLIGMYGFTNSQHILPLPYDVVKALVYDISSKELLIHCLMSLSRVAIGLGAATIVGIGLGILFGVSRFGRHFIVIIELFRPISPIAWIPIAILWFGIGEISAYFIIFIAAFFPIFTNTFSGITSVRPIFIDVARAFNLKNKVYLCHVLLPSAAPHIITGIRIALGVGWMAVIAAEMVAARSGLGYFIQINRLLLQSSNVVAGMVVIGVIGYVMNYITAHLGDFLMPWADKVTE